MQHAGPVTSESTFLVHRFRLEREVGRGGAGTVFEAFDVLQERRVALKLLRPSAADQDESLRAEFRTLRALSHPGIVQVYDFGRTADDAPFYTMELLAGGDLASPGEPVDPHALLVQAARALDYLHASGLVHSDLKPSNVFRVGASFKLTDFGLVRRTQGPRRDAPYGTLAYMPPERLRGGDRPPDPREDLYALGAILFETLAGKPPYAGATPEATVARVLAGDLDAELAPLPEPWARLLRRLLAADPAARFPSAWDLLAGWSAQFDRPLPAPQVWSAPFVGRRRETAAVRAALAETARERGTLFWVSGGPGVGKSTLLDAAAAQAASSGLPCWRIEAPAAPRPRHLVEALAVLYRRWAPALPDSLRDAAQALLRWPADLESATDAASAVNVHAHALAAMRRVAAALPHVVLVDDAHRLDHASLDALRFLGTGVRDAGVVILVGARSGTTGDPVETDVGATLSGDFLRARQDGAAVQVLSLRELGPEDVSVLVRRRFESSPDFESLAQRIYDLTRGHPFFVQEALQHLLITGQLRRRAQGWQLPPQTDRKLLPPMADTILSEHVTVARAEDREVYEALALFPAGSPPEVLARVLERRDAAVREACERGLRIGLLVTGPEGFRFGHELIREACADRCPTATARRLHRRIAGALAGTPAEAYHRLAAGERTAESRDCYLREARHFEERSAPWEALRYYAAALETDPRAPDADTLSLRVAELEIQVGETESAAALLLQRLGSLREPQLRARALHQLGRAYEAQGRNDEALYHLQAAADLVWEHADAAGRAAFSIDLVTALVGRGDTPTAIDACRQALGALGDADPRSRAQLLLLQARAARQSSDYAAADAACRAALEVLKPLRRTLEHARTYTEIGINYLYAQDFEQAERFYRAALKVHTELGDLHGMKSAYHNLGSSLMRAGKLEEAIPCYQQSLELKRRLGDRPGEGNSLNNLGNLLERRGEHRRAFQCFRRGIGIYRRLNRPRELATLYNNMGEVHMRLGRYPRALRLLQRAQAHAAALGDAYIAQVVGHNLGSTLLALRDPQAAIRALAGALPAVQRSGIGGLAAQYHATLACASAAADDPARADFHVREALEALRSPAEDEARIGALLDLGEAAAVLGRQRDLEERAHEAERLSCAGRRQDGQARAARLLALADQRRGDWDRAEGRLEEAITICTSNGYKRELALCSKQLAGLRWDLGMRQRAREDFERSARLLLELGLRAEVGLVYLEWARLAGSARPEA